MPIVEGVIDGDGRIRFFRDDEVDSPVHAVVTALEEPGQGMPRRGRDA